MNPSAVLVGVPKDGVRAAFKADDDTVPEPFGYPARVVVTVTVADAPPDKPVTVNGNTEPFAVPAETEPASTVGDHVKLAS